MKPELTATGLSINQLVNEHSTIQPNWPNENVLEVQLKHTDKYSQHNSIIWPVRLTG